MRGEHLLSKLSFIDHKWVKEAEIKKKNNYKVANQLMIKEIENFTECLRQSNEMKSIK